MEELYINTLINSIAEISAELRGLSNELKELTNNQKALVEYDGKTYTYLQHEQILKGIEAGVDVSLYSDPKYDDLKMAVIRNALLKKTPLKTEDLSPSYDLSQLFMVVRAKNSLADCSLINPSLPADKMAIYITACEKGVDIVPFINEFDASRLEIILNCLVNNYDVNKIAIAGLSLEQMQVIYDGLERNLDVSQYNSVDLSKDEMLEMYEKLLRNDFSLSYYCLPSFAYSEFEHEYDNIEDALEYRNANNGSVGVIVTFNNILKDSRVFEKYQLLNSFNELNFKSIDHLFEDAPYLKENEAFVRSIKSLIIQSKVYVPESIKEKYFGSLPEYQKVSVESIGGNKR